MSWFSSFILTRNAIVENASSYKPIIQGETEKDTEYLKSNQILPIFRLPWVWIFHLMILSTSGLMFYKARTEPRYCIQQLSPYSPALDIFSDVEIERRFDFQSNSQSPISGPPSPDRDAAWDRITNIGAMSVSEETRMRIDASDGSVKLPEESGGGYMAIVEFIHEMHCINLMWKHGHAEYYEKEYNRTIENPEEWYEHLDHCAEILRQKVMCNADVTIVTYNWLKHHAQPHPNFNNKHKCRNFDAAVEWALAAQAPSPKEGKMQRPTDGTEYFEYDEAPFDPRALS